MRNKTILAIDAGNVQSGYVIMDALTYKPLEYGKTINGEILDIIARKPHVDVVVLEMVAHYGTGMPAGATVFDTCVWIGRFTQAAVQCGIHVERIYRREEKIAICGSMKAKDANIRQALIDRFASTPNGKGTKKNPDFFYGFAADAWQAYACGVAWIDKGKGELI